MKRLARAALTVAIALLSVAFLLFVADGIAARHDLNQSLRERAAAGATIRKQTDEIRGLRLEIFGLRQQIEADGGTPLVPHTPPSAKTSPPSGQPATTTTTPAGTTTTTTTAPPSSPPTTQPPSSPPTTAPPSQPAPSQPPLIPPVTLPHGGL